MIKRYDSDYSNESVVEDLTGEFVYYNDHLAEIQKRDELLKRWCALDIGDWNTMSALILETDGIIE